MSIKNHKILKQAVIILVSMIVIAYVLMLDPIAQDIQYHAFKDQRTISDIPNFWNVISNLPFLMVGAMGLYGILYSHSIKLIDAMKASYIIFFASISLVAFGSAYYHLWPDNSTLAWDRLPMAIAFMALFSVLIGEHTSIRLGKLALLPLTGFGAFSVIYWQSSEVSGAGDLRLYILVQFLPIIIAPLILLLFKSRFTNTWGYWLLFCSYLLAKVFEHFDVAIYNIPILLSGHTFKHVVAAIGLLILLRAYTTREPSSNP